MSALIIKFSFFISSGAAVSCSVGEQRASGAAGRELSRPEQRGSAPRPPQRVPETPPKPRNPGLHRAALCLCRGQRALTAKISPSVCKPGRGEWETRRQRKERLRRESEREDRERESEGWAESGERILREESLEKTIFICTLVNFPTPLIFLFLNSLIRFLKNKCQLDVLFIPYWLFLLWTPLVDAVLLWMYRTAWILIIQVEQSQSNLFSGHWKGSTGLFAVKYRNANGCFL